MVMITAPVLDMLPTNQDHLILARLDHACLSDLDDLANEYLTGTEWSEFEQCRHPGRRSEWLGARICLKNLLVERGIISDPQQAVVIKGSRGRPQVVRSNDGLPLMGDCSITHAQSYCVAGWTSRPRHRLGVDLELISARLERVRGAFLAKDDAAAKERPALEQLTIWWCLKEAFSKAVGQGLGAGLSEITCRETVPGVHRMRHEAGCEMSGWHWRFDDFVIAWCDYCSDSSGSSSLTTA